MSATGHGGDDPGLHTVTAVGSPSLTPFGVGRGQGRTTIGDVIEETVETVRHSNKADTQQRSRCGHAT